MRRIYWTVSILIVVCTAIASAVLYPQLPDRIPIHWNFRGEIDGYGPKNWAIWFFPAVLLGLLGLFAVLPKLTTKSMSMEGFKDTYAFVVMASIGILAFVDALTLLAATHHAVDFPRTLMLAVFVAFALQGNVLGKVTRNPYVGIKVPWTLLSDKVWNATHRLGAWLFTACGIVGIVLTASGGPLWLTPVPLLIAALVPIVYSFMLYRKLEARGEL
ncbi:MAG: hypothetical protein JWN86_111 [Planctomycetota bacterium]|nr:hypothetical protein [Planctomycetota bacterium]